MGTVICEGCGRGVDNLKVREYMRKHPEEVERVRKNFYSDVLTELRRCVIQYRVIKEEVCYVLSWTFQGC